MSRRAAPYARVSPGFWRDSKRHQWTSDATMLGIYLLTCEHKTTEGLFALPLEYARADLPGRWSTPKIKKALGELEAHGFAYYDHDSGVVLLPHAMKIQRPDAPGQRKAAKGKLAALPATSLWSRFLQAAEMYAQDFHKELEQEVLDGMYPDMQDAMVHSLALALAPTLSPAPAPTLAPTPTHTHTQYSKLNTQNSSSIAQDSMTQGSDSSVSVSPEPSVDNESKVTPLTTDLQSSSGGSVSGLNEGMTGVPLTTVSNVPIQASGGLVDPRGDEEPSVGEVVDSLVERTAALFSRNPMPWADEYDAQLTS
jgi:hypothetical protein